MSDKTARDSAPPGMKNNRTQLQSEITNLSAHLSHRLLPRANHRERRWNPAIARESESAGLGEAIVA